MQIEFTLASVFAVGESSPSHKFTMNHRASIHIQAHQVLFACHAINAGTQKNPSHFKSQSNYSRYPQTLIQLASYRGERAN